MLLTLRVFGQRVRAEIKERGATPVISTKKNRRVQIESDAAIYALRNRIERGFNRLKNAPGFATGDDNLAETLAGFVHLVAIMPSHFVNTA